MTHRLGGPIICTMAKKSKQSDPKDQLMFDAPEQLLLDALILTHDAVVAKFQELLRGYDISYTQYTVLTILAEEGEEGLRTQKLGARLLTRLPDITRLVDRLVRDGLVERNRWEKDKRVVFVIITEAGMDLLEELKEPFDALQVEMFGHLSDDKQIQLNTLLAELRNRNAIGK